MEGDFNEWEKYMDACAKRLLQESGESVVNLRRSLKSNNKKMSRKGMKKRGPVERKVKGRAAANNKIDKEEKAEHRSRSRGVKRQKSKSVAKKDFVDSQEDEIPSRKRQRQKSIAFDNEDATDENA